MVCSCAGPLGDSLPGPGCDLPVSGVHLSVWLKSQEFPETESSGFRCSRGFCQVSGACTASFQRFCCLSGLRDTQRAQSPEPSSNSQRPPLWSSHSQGLLRGLFLQVSPRLPPAVSPQRGSLPRRSQRSRRSEGRRREVAPVDAGCRGTHREATTRLRWVAGDLKNCQGCWTCVGTFNDRSEGDVA